MLSDLQLVYMVPKNSTQLLKINTTKFQVEREPVYHKYNRQVVVVVVVVEHCDNPVHRAALLGHHYKKNDKHLVLSID